MRKSAVFVADALGPCLRIKHVASIKPFVNEGNKCSTGSNFGHTRQGPVVVEVQNPAGVLDLHGHEPATHTELSPPQAHTLSVLSSTPASRARVCGTHYPAAASLTGHCHSTAKRLGAF